MLCLCYCGTETLRMSRLSGACFKSSCTPGLQIGRVGSPPTKTCGRAMVEELTIGCEEIASLQSGEFNSSAFMLSDEIIWPVPPDNLALGATDVHVWAASLEPPAELMFRCA